MAQTLDISYTVGNKAMIADLTILKSGFCDRLKLLTFYIAAATATNDRTIYIKEQRTHDGPFLFMEFCEIEGFEIKEWRENAPGSSLPVEYFFEPGIKPSLKFVRRNKPKNIQMSDEEFLKLWIHSYTKVRPLAHIKEKIDGLGLGEKCLGLHIRVTDKCVPNIIESVTPNCMTAKQVASVNKILEKQIRGSTKIYLAADSEEWNRKWTVRLRELKYDAVSNNATYDSSNFRQTSGEDFIMDLFSLARCGSIAGTVASGVPICASYINGSGNYSFAFDRLVIGKKINAFRWKLYYRWHVSLFDFYHSEILGLLFKIPLIKAAATKARAAIRG